MKLTINQLKKTKIATIKDSSPTQFEFVLNENKIYISINVWSFNLTCFYIRNNVTCHNHFEYLIQNSFAGDIFFEDNKESINNFFRCKNKKRLIQEIDKYVKLLIRNLDGI